MPQSLIRLSGNSVSTMSKKKKRKKINEIPTVLLSKKEFIKLSRANFLFDVLEKFWREGKINNQKVVYLPEFIFSDEIALNSIYNAYDKIEKAFDSSAYYDKEQNTYIHPDLLEQWED